MENDYKYKDPGKNHFLSRGCSHAPQIYQDNTKIATHRCCKLNAHDWLKDLEIPKGQEAFDCIEVRFKNSRKEFFRLTPDLKFVQGDIVAVEASPGHDIGIVSLSGEIVRLQMKKKNVDPEHDPIKKVYRRARLSDIEKWLNAVDLEDRSQIKTRKIAYDLGLAMKINDVEYQGDETKAVFYYTAEERVDFRELIKMLADEFKVRIEMRQIGARQEAARLGGIGSCGRELCCSTWLTDFTSVTTNTARTQQLSPNPQKLAGQCGKLKCCLNYENDVYLDALKDFPNTNIILKTEKGDASHQKSDVFKRIMWYAYVNDYSNMLALSVDRVLEIVEQNKRGVLPKQLEDHALTMEIKTEVNNGGLTEEDINRFDKMKDPTSEERNRRKSKKKSGNRRPPNMPDKSGQKPQGQQQRNKPQDSNRPEQKANKGRQNTNAKSGENKRPDRPPRSEGDQNPQRKAGNKSPNLRNRNTRRNNNQRRRDNKPGDSGNKPQEPNKD